MPCYKPLKAFRTPTGVVFQELSRYDIIGRIDLPCGQCIGCRMRKASDWALRCSHEATLQPENCFITLTYGRDNLPPGGSLEHRDWQLFFKRLRKHFAPIAVRFYMCGEYGPLTGRAHYHACLFGVDFRDDRILQGKSNSGMDFYASALLERLWGHGRVSVQDLTRETAGYCARYIMSKVTGDEADAEYRFVDADGVVHNRKPPYAAMSLKPGIGAGWFAKYGRDVYPHDFVIADGVKIQPPVYYDRLFKRTDDIKIEQVEFAREKRAKAAWKDNTDARLQVREVVHKARIRNLRREME